jgi:uncharacterized protein YdeI (YjbR/CyaY-like superfamily)
MKRKENVQQYIQKYPEWQSLLTSLQDILKNSELEETIKWGAPVYTIAGKNVVGLAAFKNYAGLWFFNGALLKDNNKQLVNAQEGKTKAMRQWRFSSLSEIDEALVKTYIEEAIELQKAGIQVTKAKPTKDFEMPIELKSALQSDQHLSTQFKTLTPYKKKEYAEYISSAKRESTRQNRLEKCIPMIISGIGLNDKYRNC